jgi:hypothetical protein
MKQILSIAMLAMLIVGCNKNNNTNNPTITNKENVEALAPVYTVNFSGYTWQVKDFGTTKAGPGPNLWSNNNVWVDANGYLHLLLQKNASNKWVCAEVKSTTTFGNGTFQWKLDGNVAALDKNVVLGLFQYSGVDGTDELDIEFAKWGNINNKILNYTVWPATLGLPNFHITHPIATMTGTFSTHRYIKSSNTVVFKSLNGHYNDDTNLYATSTASVPTNSITSMAMPVYMNLWCFQGTAPSNKKSVEIIIREFTYIP